MDIVKPLRFLDIDLDTFVHGIKHYPEGGRLDPLLYPAWDEAHLRTFLEKNCGLSQKQRVPGRLVKNHDEAFDYLKGLYLSNGPMELVHIDAHADLGMGDPSWTHMIETNLRRTPIQRMRPKRAWNGMNLGSWLAYVLAARWLTKLTYVHPDKGGRDLPPIWFRSGDINCGVIEMKTFNRDRLDPMPSYEMLCSMVGDHVEPAVPFDRTTIETYSNSQPFDYALLCQSPDYTSPLSDGLISVFEDYISFENDTDFYTRAR